MFGEFADLKKFKTPFMGDGLDGTILLNTNVAIKNICISLMEEYPKRSGIYLSFMEAYPVLYMGTKEKLYKAAKEAGAKDIKSAIKHMAESYAATIGPNLMQGFLKSEGYPIARITKGVTKDPTLIVAFVNNESVSSYEFDGCSNLRIVVLLDSVKRVGANAFAGCPNLKTVYANAETVISDTAFPSDVKIKLVGGATKSALPTEADISKYLSEHKELIPVAQPTEEAINEYLKAHPELLPKAEVTESDAKSYLDAHPELIPVDTRLDDFLKDIGMSSTDEVKTKLNNSCEEELKNAVVRLNAIMHKTDFVPQDPKTDIVGIMETVSTAFEVWENNYKLEQLELNSVYADLRLAAVSQGIDVAPYEDGGKLITSCKELSSKLATCIEKLKAARIDLIDDLVPIAIALNGTVIRKGGEPVSVSENNIVEALTQLVTEVSKDEPKSITTQSVDDAIEVLKTAVAERRINPSKIRELSELTKKMSKELTPRENAIKIMEAHNVPESEYDNLSREVAESTPEVVKNNFPGTFEELIESGIRSRFEQTTVTRSGVSLADVYSEIRTKYQCQPGDINHIYRTLAEECGYSVNSPNTEDKMSAVLNKLKEE